MVNENVLVNHTIEFAFLTGNEVHGVNYIKLKYKIILFFVFVSLMKKKNVL